MPPQTVPSVRLPVSPEALLARRNISSEALCVNARSMIRPRNWFVAQGRIAEAEREIEKLMRRDPLYPRKVVLNTPGPGGDSPHHKGGYGKLFSKKKNRQATILASVPWFLQA